MKNFEYRINDVKMNHLEMERVLKNESENGWELASTLAMPEAGFAWFIYKREKPEIQAVEDLVAAVLDVRSIPEPILN